MLQHIKRVFFERPNRAAAERANPGTFDENPQGGGTEPVQDLFQSGNRLGADGMLPLHHLLPVLDEPEDLSDLQIANREGDPHNFNLTISLL